MGRVYGKYHSVKTTVDGIKFDSLTEASFYTYLKGLGYALEDTMWLQVKYTVQEKFRFNEKAIRPINYLADIVLKIDDKDVVIDVKGGFLLPVFKIKAKMMKFVLGIDVLVVVRAPQYYTKATGVEWILHDNIKKIQKEHKGDKNYKELKFKRTLKQVLTKI